MEEPAIRIEAPRQTENEQAATFNADLSPQYFRKGTFRKPDRAILLDIKHSRPEPKGRAIGVLLYCMELMKMYEDPRIARNELMALKGDRIKAAKVGNIALLESEITNSEAVYGAYAERYEWVEAQVKLAYDFYAEHFYRVPNNPRSGVHMDHLQELMERTAGDNDLPLLQALHACRQIGIPDDDSTVTAERVGRILIFTGRQFEAGELPLLHRAGGALDAAS